MSKPVDPHPELAFFNGLSGWLRIDFNLPDRELFDRDNPPNWKTVQLMRFEFEIKHYLPEEQDFCPLTDEELDSVAFVGGHIVLRNLNLISEAVAVRHEAPNGRYFTVKQLRQAIEDTERAARIQFGEDRELDLDCLDAGHVYFEGIGPQQDGSWLIYWGS